MSIFDNQLREAKRRYLERVQSTNLQHQNSLEDLVGNDAQNWQCKCGRGPSLDHGVGEYCQAREIIESLESKLARYEEALKKIASYGDCHFAYKAKQALEER